MRQQVNLYQPMFRRQRRVFSAQAMVYAVALAVLGLGAVYGFSAWRLLALQADVAALEAQRDAALERLVGLERELPTRQRSRLLEAEVARAEADLERKEGVVATLANGELGNFGGFSRHLEGFARRRVDGLWLSGFSIGRGGRELSVDGAALAPELVPTLVQRLGDEDVFAGLSFRTLRMQRVEEGPARVQFALDTAEAEG